MQSDGLWASLHNLENASQHYNSCSMNIWPHCSRAGKKKSQSFKFLGEKSTALPLFASAAALLLQEPARLWYPHLRQKETVTAKRKATWQDDKHGEYQSAFMWDTEWARMRGWAARAGLAFVAANCAAQARCQRGETDTEHELCRVPLCSAAEAFISCQATTLRALAGLWQLRFLQNPSVLAGRWKGKGGMKGLQCFLCPLPRNWCSLEVSASFPSCSPPPQFQN